MAVSLRDRCGPLRVRYGQWVREGLAGEGTYWIKYWLVEEREATKEE